MASFHAASAFGSLVRREGLWQLVRPTHYLCSGGAPSADAYHPRRHGAAGGSMKIAIIGAGNVGTSLAGGWRKVGHDIIFGVRNPAGRKAELAALGDVSG